MGKERAKLILQQILILAEAFGLSISEARQQIYVEALIDYEPDKIKQAVGQIIKTRTFAGNLPTVAEIIEAVENKLPLDTRAAIAWDKFAYALQYHCPYDSVSFDDPIIIHIIQTWGDWPSMGDWDTNETHYWRKEFMKLYQAFAKSNNPPKTPEYLIGLTEYENSKKGFLEYIPKPFLIGMNGGEVKGIPFNPQILKRISHQKEA